MRLPPALKTTAARLSALYLLLFAACAVLLVYYMTALSAEMLTGQTQETINEEAVDLANSYQRGGLPALVRTIEWRARQPSANLYLIADSNGRILSGNVASLEPGILDTNGWTQKPFSYKRFGESSARSGSDAQAGNSDGDGAAQTPSAATMTGHAAIALVLRLPNQMIVLVGRDLNEPERFREVVQRALILALAMMGLGGIAIWWVVGRRALKRIDAVSQASRRIMGGDLSGRLPVSGAGDEFDRLSENLNLMLDRIQELNEGLKQVSDNIAHDLKTPLTRLRSRAEAALSAGKDGGAYKGALDATIAESDQLIRTFNAILMISRLEAGYSAEHTEKIDFSAVVRDVVELYEPAADDLGVTVRSKVSEGISLAGNRELIAQAISNVVDNAIKYSADGEAPVVDINLLRQDGSVLLDVSDNGPGIPDEADRKRATERFVRLEKSRSQPGSGLGLSLANAVVRFHGGQLDLKARERGLSVLMRFPLKEAA